jgi:hypothetical protein
MWDSSQVSFCGPVKELKIDFRVRHELIILAIAMSTHNTKAEPPDWGNCGDELES